MIACTHVCVDPFTMHQRPLTGGAGGMGVVPTSAFQFCG